MILVEIETPENLPNSERHVSIPADTLREALALLKINYVMERINLERVFYSRSDQRYWFALSGNANARKTELQA